MKVRRSRIVGSFLTISVARSNFSTDSIVLGPFRRMMDWSTQFIFSERLFCIAKPVYKVKATPRAAATAFGQSFPTRIFSRAGSTRRYPLVPFSNTAKRPFRPRFCLCFGRFFFLPWPFLTPFGRPLGFGAGEFNSSRRVMWWNSRFPRRANTSTFTPMSVMTLSSAVYSMVRMTALS